MLKNVIILLGLIVIPCVSFASNDQGNEGQPVFIQIPDLNLRTQCVYGDIKTTQNALKTSLKSIYSAMDGVSKVKVKVKATRAKARLATQTDLVLDGLHVIRSGHNINISGSLDNLGVADCPDKEITFKMVVKYKSGNAMETDSGTFTLTFPGQNS